MFEQEITPTVGDVYRLIAERVTTSEERMTIYRALDDRDDSRLEAIKDELSTRPIR